MASVVENMAVSSVTRYEREKGRTQAEEVILRQQVPPLRENGMRRIGSVLKSVDPRYSDKSVSSDIFRMQRKRDEIARVGVDKVLPGAVELLSRAWLDSGEMLFSDCPAAEAPLATHCSEFDDYMNGADIAKTLVLSPETAKEYGVPKESTFAFDITIARNPETIHRKFEAHANGLPYGFTTLKYFAEKRLDEEFRGKSGKDSIPRFVLGIDADCARKTLDLMSKNNEGIEGYLDHKSPDSAEIQFKLLSEIHTEAEFFLSQMPDNPFSKRDQVARGMLELAADRSQESLEKCAEKILPIVTQPGADGFAPSFSTPQIPVLSSYELEEAKKQRFRSAREGLDYLTKKFRDKEGFHYDASFDAIIAETESRLQANVS